MQYITKEELVEILCNGMDVPTYFQIAGFRVKGTRGRKVRTYVWTIGGVVTAAREDDTLVFQLRPRTS